MTMAPNGYAGRDGLLTLHEECRTLVGRRDPADIDQLSHLLLVRAEGILEEREIPYIVASALASQPDGMVQLLNVLRKMPGRIYPTATVETLWRIAEGLSEPHTSVDIPYEPYIIDENTRRLAREKLVDLIVEAEHSSNIFKYLLAILEACGSSEPGTFGRFFLESIRESSIVLTSRLLQEFDTLIQDTSHEESYQTFLKCNPVFVNPLAAEVMPKRKLGNDLVTDFVIRTHDYRYVVVEIEKPRNRIFTGRSEFTKEFTHAVGQVLDFQGWVADNIAYAQKSLPSIDRPHGMVIIGRRSEMSDEQQAKLRRWLINSRAIEVLTYDDVLERAKILYCSLRRTALSSD